MKNLQRAHLPLRGQAFIVAAVAAMMLVISSPAFSKKVGGSNVPDTVSIGGADIPFRGGGVRKRAFFSIYAAGLYTEETSGDGNTISAADEPMAIHLLITSTLISKNKLIAALKTGFNKSTNGDTSAVQDGIDQMIAAFVKPLNPGTSYTLAYEPGVGTTMYRNAEVAVVVEGLEFKKALFGIWLGDKPVQANLKKGMLSSS